MQSIRANSQVCAGGASKGGLGTRALLWAVGCCVRCVVLEVDGLACVLSQAGEPGPPGAGGRGAPGSPSDPEARDAIVLEVRRIALLPCAGAAPRPVQGLACGVQGFRMWAFCWRSITCRPLCNHSHQRSVITWRCAAPTDERGDCSLSASSEADAAGDEALEAAAASAAKALAAGNAAGWVQLWVRPWANEVCDAFSMRKTADCCRASDALARTQPNNEVLASCDGSVLLCPT